MSRGDWLDGGASSPEAQRSEALARFHRALVEEILRTRPSYLREPFTVAEIYQNLVPYRTHRDRIGVEMNGDYEDALLRLLAGEGEYLVLESELARGQIANELLSPNPNTGLFREFAAVDVRLNPLRMPRDLPDPVRGPAVGPDLAASPPMREPPFVPPVAAPPQQHAGPASMPGVQTPAAPTPIPGTPAAPAGEAKAERSAPTACAWCREALPRRAILNYCPFCGADLHTHPCATCGEELEVGWRFCVACGTPVGDVD